MFPSYTVGHAVNLQAETGHGIFQHSVKVQIQSDPCCVNVHWARGGGGPKVPCLVTGETPTIRHF